MFLYKKIIFILERIRLTMGEHRLLGGERERLSPFSARFPGIEVESFCYTLESTREILLYVRVSG